MPVIPSRIDTFIEDVQREGAVWAIHDADGIPVIARPSGPSASPFWSSEATAAEFIQGNSAYRGFDPIRITWQAFRTRWIPGLTADGLVIDIQPSQAMSDPCDIEPVALDHLMRSDRRAWRPTSAASSMAHCRAA